jgi:hypothetical protein
MNNFLIRTRTHPQDRFTAHLVYVLAGGDRRIVTQMVEVLR